MVEFSQSLEPTFDNMMPLPRKEGSETYVFQDLGTPFVFIDKSNINILEDPVKIGDGQDLFPVTASLGDVEDLFPVTIVSLEDLLMSMKNESRFVASPGPRQALYIAFFLVLSLCSIVSF